MNKTIKRIVSLIIYSLLMYVVYNVFIPDNVLLSKSDTFVRKQENIVKFERLLESTKGRKRDLDYHPSNVQKTDEARARFSCQNEGCHTDYPHKKNLKARAFYNMHSYKISCLSCHIEAKKVKNIKFGWFDEKGNFRAVGKNLKNALIAPYVMRDGYEKHIEGAITDEVQSHDDLKKVLAGFKISISKSTKMNCNSCHKQKGKLYFDLPSLGYSEDKIKALRDSDEAKMFDGIFYYVNL